MNLLKWLRFKENEPKEESKVTSKMIDDMVAFHCKRSDSLIKNEADEVALRERLIERYKGSEGKKLFQKDIDKNVKAAMDRMLENANALNL